MGYDYSNARFGIHGCHCGVTRFLKEHSVVLLKKIFAYFKDWEYFCTFCDLTHLLHAKKISIWRMLKMSRFHSGHWFSRFMENCFIIVTVYVWHYWKGKMPPSFWGCTNFTPTFLLLVLFPDPVPVSSFSEIQIPITQCIDLIGLFYVSNMWQWDCCRDVDILLWLNDFNW